MQEKDGQAVEILSTKPLVPSIQAISDPDRLVIDLPNARLETQQKRISVQADQISTLRADQFQQNPPVARVVVDLLAPRAYTWDAAGNRLVVHLGKNPSQAKNSPFEPPTVPSLTPAPQPVVAAVRAAGPLALAGNDARLGFFDYGRTRYRRSQPVERRRSACLSGNDRVGYSVAEPAQPDAQHEHGRDGSALRSRRFFGFGDDAGLPHSAGGAGRISLCHQRRQSGQHLRARAARQHSIGDGHRTARRSHLPGQGNRPARVSFRATRSCGYGGAARVRMSAAARRSRWRPRQSAHAERSKQPALTAKRGASAGGDGSRGKRALDWSAGGGRSTRMHSVAPNELHVQVEAPFVFHATGPPPAPVEDVRALPLDSRPQSALALAAPLPPPRTKRRSRRH